MPMQNTRTLERGAQTTEDYLEEGDKHVEIILVSV